MTVTLETIGLTRRYGEVAALLPTDLVVYPGEFLTLLGPSGSGKTTLLMMIAGLVSPSGGQLLIGGRDATHAPPGQRDIGMVFQNYALFPHMTVWDNVAYGLRVRRRSAADLARGVEDALAMVKMQSMARRYPAELSGGQQQRIALARCFAYRPGIILLDEPLGALDRKLREHMQAEIRHLHDSSGATFIYVTHDQDEALTMSDRICLMNQARIEQIGSPADLYDRPKTVFAANFLGESNLLEGVVEVPGHLRLDADLIVPIADLSILPGTKATLLVRPELVSLTEPDQGLLTGTITELVFLGSGFKVIMALPNGNLFSVRCGRDVLPKPGDTIGVRWDIQRAGVLTR